MSRATNVRRVLSLLSFVATAFAQQSPPIPHYDLNIPGILRAYTPGHSGILSSIFQSSVEIASQPYPTPYLTSYCASGFNSIEIGAFDFDATSWATTQSAFTTEVNNYMSKLASYMSVAPSTCTLKYWLTGDGMMRTSASAYAATQGATSARNGSTFSTSGIAQWLTAYNTYNSTYSSKIAGMTMTDEYGYNLMAMQGPITLSGTTGVQNWLGSSGQIVCTSTTCTVTTGTNNPAGGWNLLEGTNPAGGFIITGSSQGFNNTLGGSTYVATSISSSSFSFPKPSGVTAGTYNSTNDPSLRFQVNACCGWYTPPGGSSATDFLADDALWYMASQMDSVTGRIPAGPSIAAGSGPIPNLVSCVNGGQYTSLCQGQHLTEGGVTEYAVGGALHLDDQYWSESGFMPFTASHTAVNAAINDTANASIQEGQMLMETYGAYDPTYPMQTIVPGTTINYGFAVPTPSQIPVSSCMGNTITLSDPHYVTNIVPGATRLTVSGSTDSNCNTNLVVLGAPTSTTLTVAYAATKSTYSECTSSALSGCTWGSSNITISGTSVTWNSGDQFPSWLAGKTILYNFGNNTATVSTVNSATSLTLTTSPSSFTGNAYFGAGGTATFANGDNISMAYVSADGETNPMGAGTSLMAYAPLLYACGFGGSGGSASFLRHRGQTVTFSGVPSAAGGSYFNNTTFVYDIENLSQPTDNNGNTNTCDNYIREIPSFSGTGGTASITYDGSYVQGRNAGAVGVAGNTDPGWTFVNKILAMILRAAGTRQYQMMPDNVAYTSQATSTPFLIQGGWVGSALGSVAVYGASAPGTLQYQLYSHPNVENGYSVPDFWAGSVAGRMWQRLCKYYCGAVALNSVDYGNGIESGTFQSSYGHLHVILNATNGSRSLTVNLAPYETAGQNAILWIADATHGIAPLTIINAGTVTSSLTLHMGQAAFYLFPVSFASELQQPALSLSLADGGPNATSAAAQCGYDQYLLPLATPFSLGSGTGGLVTATLPYDKTFGPIYCTISYLGSTNQQVAGGANSAVITF